MTKPTLVIALGGNALLCRGEPLEAELQRKNVAVAVKTIAELSRDWHIVLVHGNGPQVGLLALQNSAYTQVTPYPLDILGAETQGMIGYLLLQELENALPHVSVSALLTQVEVSPDDPAFNHPTKYIGPVYNQEEAIALETSKGWTFKADGHYYRRVVPSPLPLRIVESKIIKDLIQQGNLVICTGGGGIPVMVKDGKMVGIEAVIDKDMSAAYLARQIHADALLILTDAPAVYLDWGKPTQRPLERTTPQVLAQYIFDEGSMGPKIKAACEFVTVSGGIVGIGSLQDGARILNGEKGTLIVPQNHQPSVGNKKEAPEFISA